MKYLIVIIFSISNSFPKYIETEGVYSRSDLFFKNTINKYKKEFKEEAMKRGILSDLNQFKFKIIKNKEFFQPKCIRETKEILLSEDLKESTFYHEVGHCLFGYSHRHIEDDSRKDYIMNYAFDDDHLSSKRKEVLDIFFDKNKHHQFDSLEGVFEHKKMVLYHQLGIDVSKMTPAQINTFYKNPQAALQYKSFSIMKETKHKKEK